MDLSKSIRGRTRKKVNYACTANEPARNVATDYETDCKTCHIPARKDDRGYVRGYPVLKKHDATH